MGTVRLRELVRRRRELEESVEEFVDDEVDYFTEQIEEERIRLSQVDEPPQQSLSMHDRYFLFLHALHSLGRQTKLQLMQRGFTNNQVEHLVRCGILLREHDPATNLYYLKVDDGHISS